MKQILLLALAGVGVFAQSVIIGKPVSEAKSLVTAEIYHFGDVGDQVVLRVIPKDKGCESIEVSIAYEDLNGNVKTRTVTVDRYLTWAETYGVINLKIKRLISASIREIEPSDTFTF